MNLINEANKPKVTKTIVVYAGRFQPFHKGHYAAYQHLVSEFGSGNVYIATSNDTSSDKSPFSFNEKKEIATKMFGVPSNKFVKVSNPYRPMEILKKFDGTDTQYIAAVGEKDADRLHGKYFKPYNGKAGYGYDEIGYTYPIPGEENPISGTQVRKGLGSDDKEKAKKFFLKAYPKFDKDIFKMITSKLNEGFPGGIGVGLDLPGGYINGAPTGSTNETLDSASDSAKYRYEPHPTRHEREHPSDEPDWHKKNEPYDPIAEILSRVVTEEAFNEFITGYLGEAPNKALDRDITYTNAQGKATKIKARDALRLPKEHPAHIQAAKIVGPNDAPANEPKTKEQPGKAATQAAKPAEPGQPVKQGQTAQGKIDKQTTNQPTSAGAEQGPPPEQKLSGKELHSNAEKRVAKQAINQTTKGYVERIGKKIEHWSNKEKEFFKKKVHHGNSPERRSWGKAILDKAKGAGHAIMHGLKHEFKEFKTAAIGVGKLMSGKQLDKHDKEAMWNVGKKIVITGLMAAMGGGLAHGVGMFAKHVAIELVPHAVSEVVIGGVGKAAMFAEDVNPATQLNIFAAAIAERIVNMDITPKMMEDMIDSYNNKKLESKFKLNENVSESKQNSINHFVEYATKRLKLKQTPNVNLISGREFAEVKTSLGGYNPDDKSIYVATEGRLTADILRTIAHEMVHRKQDELGLVKNIQKDGADGSPIENQAHAVAGILMREYGRINKQIYNEATDTGNHGADGIHNNHNVSWKEYDNPAKGYVDMLDGWEVYGHLSDELPEEILKQELPVNTHIDPKKAKGTNHLKEDINLDVDKGDTVLMGKFKNKKVVVKDFGKDDHGMPTINGKVATTFRMDKKGQNIYEMGSKDVHFKNVVKYFDKGGPNIKKQVSLVVCGSKKPNRDEIVGSLRDMGYEEITAIEKRLGIEDLFEKKNLKEVSLNTAQDGQPDGGYLPKGKVRKLDANDGVNKNDDWFYSGGYTQTDFPKADAIWGDDDENQTIVKYSARNLPRFDEEPTKFLKEELLMEGGAYGHMSHPFDDMDLTFGDLKDIITKALEGDLGVVREKTDGQALAISWKNGRLIAARNKGNLANAGANAMGIEDVASKFAGRGGLTDAYNFAMRDLSAAVQSLSEAQRKKIFNEGKCFMNLEVIWPSSVNVIPYGQALLVFHNTTCYDEKGNAIGADQGTARALAGMIKQVNADVQSKYTIQGPPVTEIPKSADLASKKGKYLSRLNKLQNEFGLKDSDNVATYHQNWWENFIDTKAPSKVDKLTKEALIRRWAFGDKGFRLNTISNPKLQEWAIDNDKVNVVKQQKENIKPFEEIFLGVGADVLEFVGSVLTVHPDKAIRSMKEKLKSVASQVRDSGSPAQIQKLKQELSRLNQLGGKDKIVPNEGIVFVYKGNTYKLTGTFAPLNQILGIFYE